jgi:hypothetical protein
MRVSYGAEPSRAKESRGSSGGAKEQPREGCYDPLYSFADLLTLGGVSAVASTFAIAGRHVEIGDRGSVVKTYLLFSASRTDGLGSRNTISNFLRAGSIPRSARLITYVRSVLSPKRCAGCVPESYDLDLILSAQGNANEHIQPR